MSKELDQLRITATYLSNGVSHSVKSLAEAGFRYLMAAHKTHFEDFSYLDKSYESLTKALQRDRQNAQLYIHLGYLCVLVEDYQTAHQFFDTLLSLKPGHPDALIFMDYLQFRAPELFSDLKQESFCFKLDENLLDSPQKNTISLGKQQVSSDFRAAQQEARKESDEIDLDHFYEKVEKRIYHKVQTSMRLNLPEMSLEASELKILETHQEQLSLFVLDLHQDLERLEKEIDITALQQLVRPLEQQLERIQSSLELSRLFRRLRGMISKLTREVIETHGQWDKKNLSSVIGEQSLESYLDRCDGIADELEELESTGRNITALEKPYQRVVSLLESLQEKLDG